MISLPDGDGVAAILLVTSRCQLDCGYCELDRTGGEMSLELVEQVMLDLDRLVPPERALTFVWHGGEPLLRGLSFFQWVHEFQAPIRARRRVSNTLQTNGLLLDDAFLDFLEASGDFWPSISMDGPLSARTRGVDTAPYEALFARLKTRGLEFGVSVTGSPELRERLDEVLAYFREHAIGGASMTLYQVCGKDASPRPDPGLLADLVLEADGRRVNPLGRVYLRAILGQMLHGDCRLSGFAGHCHRRTICVGPQGELHTCLRGKWSGLWSWGTVAGGGLEAWRAAWDGPAPFRPCLPEACEPCAWKHLCQGGCPSNAKAMLGDATRPDFYCPSLQKLFAAAQGVVLEEMFALVDAERSRN